MKQSLLIQRIQENYIEGTEDFEVEAHTEKGELFIINFVFWHEGKLYIALKEKSECQESLTLQNKSDKEN